MKWKNDELMRQGILVSCKFSTRAWIMAVASDGFENRRTEALEARRRTGRA